MNVHVRAGSGARVAERALAGPGGRAGIGASTRAEIGSDGAPSPDRTTGAADRPPRPEPADRRLAPRETVFSAGDPADAPFEVVEGCVVVWTALPDGRRQILQVALAGDAFGFAAAGRHATSAETVVPTRLIALASGGDGRREAALVRRLAALEAHALLLGRMTALERVASFLARLAGAASGSGSGSSSGSASGSAGATVALPLTRAEIADHLGLTVETVSRSLTKLRHAGVIRLDRPEQAVIQDAAALAAAAGRPVVSASRSGSGTGHAAGSGSAAARVA